MGLSDIVSHSGTTAFAQVGFVISFVVFTLIVIWALLKSKASVSYEARSALCDGIPAEEASRAKEPCHE